MSNPSRMLLFASLLFSLCAAPYALAAYEHPDSRHDPSGRVAHLTDIHGEVSYSPAGEDHWTDALRNRPLIRGDRLWTDGNARVELQVGSAAIRLGADTNFEILNLSDRIAQVRVTEGTLYLRVSRLYPGQTYEVATPTLAFTVSRPGRYRIDVGGRGDQTTVAVWEGAGEAHGDRARFPLRAGDAVTFYGDDLRDHEVSGLPRADAFDRYCVARDRRLARSASLRHLDDDVVGYADLDDYGSWRPARGYGTLWFPSRVDADWAPYRDGHWVWQEPWGWTWVDDAPWGFAPSHYGRWVYVSNRWGWMPGPRNVRPVYAPALVAFVGGRGWSVSVSLGSPIGWFPLAPREVYVPSYRASRDYFTRVNVTNTVINHTTITNVYNNNYGSNNTNVTQVNHANRTVAGAVTAVPSTVFVNAQPVRPAAIRVEAAAATTGEITRVAPVAPSARSVRGSGAEARARPSRDAQDRRVIARSAPPPAERPFAAREPELQRTPGQAPAPAAVAPVAAPPVAAEGAAPPATVGAAHGRDRNVRVVAEQPGAVDARAAGSRRKGQAARADQGPLPPLERAPERPQQNEPSPPPAGDAASAASAEKQRTETNEQDQRRRKAENEQQAAREEQAGRRRQAEREQQAAAQHQAEQQKLQQKQREQKEQEQHDDKSAGTAQQAAEDQRVERERLAEKQQQEQRQLKSDGDARAAQQQERAERQRVADARKLERAECERLAVEKKQDKRQCRDPGEKAPRKGSSRGAGQGGN